MHARDVQRPHLGAVPFRERNVVEIEGVLRADVAADVAVAKMNARPLLLTLRVGVGLRVLRRERILQPVVPVRRKRDGKRHLREAVRVPQLLGPLSREHEPLRQLAVRQRLQVHHLRDAVVVGLELVVA